MATAEVQTSAASKRSIARRPEENSSGRLELPETAQPVQFDWGYLFSILGIHVLSVGVCLPWLFSWTGVVVFLLGLPFYGMLGITLCYHRALTHQGLTLAKWLERSLAI